MSDYTPPVEPSSTPDAVPESARAWYYRIAGILMIAAAIGRVVGYEVDQATIADILSGVAFFLGLGGMVLATKYTTR